MAGGRTDGGATPEQRKASVERAKARLAAQGGRAADQRTLEAADAKHRKARKGK